jgi:hypothetical protein
MARVRFRDNEDLRRALKQRLSREVPDTLLDAIDREKGLVNSIFERQDETAFEDLVAEVSYLLETFRDVHGDLGFTRGYVRRGSQRESEPTVYSSDRQRVFSLLVARRVTFLHNDMRAFRSRYIGSSLLDPERVEWWILRELTTSDAHSSGVEARTKAFEVLCLKPSDPPELPLCRPYHPWEYGLPGFDESLYAKRGDELPGGRATALYRLWDIAQWVSIESGWRLGDAVWFILTGQIPEIPSIVVTIDAIREGSVAGTTIALEVDPEVAPKAVADAYRQKRNQVRSRTRGKPLEAKTLAFVEFVLSHPEIDPDERISWQPLIEEWNELEFVKSKQWQYGDRARRKVSSMFRQALKNIQPSVEHWYSDEYDDDPHGLPSEEDDGE